MQDLLTITSLILSLFATIITLVYFSNPKFQIDISKHGFEQIVKIVNGNSLFDIVDIYCEIAISETINFDKAVTLELLKDHTLCLSKKESDNYIFKTKDYNEKKHNQKYLRVRLVAPNILGVKKVITISKKIIDIKES
ncbi:MAG TPA: hypothetical protein VIK29_01895 [Paludibacter sp.]